MGALSKLAEPQGQAWDESCAPFRINEQYYPRRSNRFSLDESRLFFYLPILAVQLTAALFKTTTLSPTVPAMQLVIWFVRLEINLQELCLAVICYALGLLVWFFERHNTRKFAEANCDVSCIGPPTE